MARLAKLRTSCSFQTPAEIGIGIIPNWVRVRLWCVRTCVRESAAASSSELKIPTIPVLPRSHAHTASVGQLGELLGRALLRAAALTWYGQRQ